MPYAAIAASTFSRSAIFSTESMSVVRRDPEYHPERRYYAAAAAATP